MKHDAIQYSRKKSSEFSIEVSDLPPKVPGMCTVRMVRDKYTQWLKRRGLARTAFNGKEVAP